MFKLLNLGANIPLHLVAAHTLLALCPPRHGNHGHALNHSDFAVGALDCADFVGVVG